MRREEGQRSDQLHQGRMLRIDSEIARGEIAVASIGMARLIEGFRQWPNGKRELSRKDQAQARSRDSEPCGTALAP